MAGGLNLASQWCPNCHSSFSYPAEEHETATCPYCADDVKNRPDGYSTHAFEVMQECLFTRSVWEGPDFTYLNFVAQVFCGQREWDSIDIATQREIMIWVRTRMGDLIRGRERNDPCGERHPINLVMAEVRDVALRAGTKADRRKWQAEASLLMRAPDYPERD